MKQCFSLLAVLFLCFSAQAQAPSAFNYQGAARTLTGEPISNQTIGIRIAILQDAANGNAAYVETHETTTSNVGLFSLQVGNGNAIFGDFDAIQWGEYEHFLEVAMDASGGTDYQVIGSSQMLSVPYALYAKNTDQVWKEGDEDIYNQYSINGIQYTYGNTSYILGQTDQPQLLYPENPQILITQRRSPTDSSVFFLALMRRMEYNYEPTFELGYGAVEGPNRNLAFRVDGLTRWFAGGDGKMGINTSTPGAALQVNEGDVYIEDINRGVIMKSPNGQCWRVTVSNTGQLVPTAITCPL